METPLQEQIARYDGNQIWLDLPAWLAPKPGASASFSREQASFLGAVTEAAAPSRILEIGTDSGFGTALLVRAALRARARLSLPVPSTPLVESFDPLTYCAGNPTVAIGAAYRTLLPDLAALAQIQPDKGAADAAFAFPPGSFDLAVLASRAVHPQPALDLFYILPLLKPESCVVLRDIHLPQLDPARQGEAGAAHLFTHCPFHKIEGKNIGAIQLPKNRIEVIDFLVDLLKKPYPMPVQADYDRSVMEGIRTLLYTKFLQASL